MHIIGQSEKFLGRLLGPLLKTGFPLIGNALKPLAKSVLIPLGLTAAAPETNAAIHKKMFGSGVTTLIISNEETNDIMKIVKCLELSGFLSMPLGTLSASLLGNLLTGKGAIAMSQGRGTIREGERTFIEGQDFQCRLIV